LINSCFTVTPVPVASIVTVITFWMPVPFSTGCSNRMPFAPTGACVIGVLSGP
jgi:hypothetical protein